MDRFSLEDLATLTDDEAVRRRFDARNVRILRWAFWFFLFVSLVQILVALDTRTPGYKGARLVLTVVNFAAVAFLVPVFGRVARGSVPTSRRLLDEVARRLARAVRGAVVAYLYLQLVLLAGFALLGGAREAWYFVYGVFLLLFRLAAVELVFLYVMSAVTALAGMLVNAILGGPRFGSEFMLAVLIVNACLLAVALFVSHRARKAFLAEWHDARLRAKEQIRMRNELEFAREIQVSMLPSRNPSLDWLDIASSSIPATEVGGDYYDYFTTASGKLAVVVGDVAGHGLASGLVLSGVRSCLTLLAEELDRPSTVMGKLHRMLQATAKNRMFVTLSILLFDRERSKVTLTSAGHPPLLIRRGDGDVEEVLIAALPLGAPLQSTFEEREIAFGPGDVFVLHTDGIYEAIDGSGSPYGMPRLTSAVGRDGAAATAEGRRDEILRDLRAFQDGALQEDDMTLVVVRVVA